MSHVSPTARERSQKGSVVVKRCGVFLVMSNACCFEKQNKRKENKTHETEKKIKGQARVIWHIAFYG
jgi:hypothetical protein